MAKKTTLKIEQADELESLMGEYLSDSCFNQDAVRRDIKDILRVAGTPKDVTVAVFARLDSIGEDIGYLADEVTRGNIDSVSDGLERLDEYMGKRFLVKRPVRKGKLLTAPYKWMVWS